MPGPDPRKNRKEGMKMGPKTFFVGEDGKRKDIKLMTREERKEFNKFNEKKLRNEQAEQARSDAKELRKGGRAMYKSGMRVCKLAKKGKGRAYGKNS
jgi:hypothetical protein